LKLITILAASLLLSSRGALASIYTLLPGADIPAASSTFPTSATPLQTNSFAFSSSTLDGTITSIVYSGDSSNPYNGLTFTYLVSLTSASIDFSSEFTVGSYGGVQTDVSYNSTGGEVVPSDFGRSSGTGDILRLFYSNGGGIAPGQTGALIVVQTDAHSYQSEMGGVINSSTADVMILTPLPEPAVGSLLVTGLGALFIFRRRYSK
jgi:hypothetical protein